MRSPFALLRKGYDTPLGELPVDEAFVDEPRPQAPSTRTRTR